MDRKPLPFVLGTPPDGATKTGAKAGDITSPDPPPCTDLSDREVALFEHICSTLRAAGVEHITASLPIAIIVKTYDQWLTALDDCENRGRYGTSPNGYSYEKPWAIDERRLKGELNQWLPKACLTIPSLARVRKDTGAGGGQDDLFGDLVQHANALPGRSSQH